jgi:hypothetical protein
MNFLKYGLKIEFIRDWKVAGIFVSPKCITVNSYKPLCVLKAVKDIEAVAMQI